MDTVLLKSHRINALIKIKRRLFDQISQKSIKGLITEILASVTKEYFKTFHKLIEARLNFRSDQLKIIYIYLIIFLRSF